MKRWTFDLARTLLALLVFPLSAHAGDGDWTLKNGSNVEGDLFGIFSGAAFFEMRGGRTFVVSCDAFEDGSREKMNRWMAGWLEERREGPIQAGSSDAKITKFLIDKLVVYRDGELAPYDFASRAEPEFYAFYYSAHWCGPCRRFTPKLRAFYNAMRAQNYDNFEIVFVSSDKSAKMMQAYMQEDEMPWPAVAFNKRNKYALSKYEGSGIPCLVVVDREGRLLFHSYRGEEYLGPDAPRGQLESVLRWLRAVDASLASKNGSNTAIISGG